MVLNYVEVLKATPMRSPFIIAVVKMANVMSKGNSHIIIHYINPDFQELKTCWVIKIF